MTSTLGYWVSQISVCWPKPHFRVPFIENCELFQSLTSRYYLLPLTDWMEPKLSDCKIILFSFHHPSTSSSSSFSLSSAAADWCNSSIEWTRLLVLSPFSFFLSVFLYIQANVWPFTHLCFEGSCMYINTYTHMYVKKRTESIGSANRDRLYVCNQTAYVHIHAFAHCFHNYRESFIDARLGWRSWTHSTIGTLPSTLFPLNIISSWRLEFLSQAHLAQWHCAIPISSRSRARGPEWRIDRVAYFLFTFLFLLLSSILFGVIGLSDVRADLILIHSTFWSGCKRYSPPDEYFTPFRFTLSGWCNKSNIIMDCECSLR